MFTYPTYLLSISTKKAVKPVMFCRGDVESILINVFLDLFTT